MEDKKDAGKGKNEEAEVKQTMKKEGKEKTRMEKKILRQRGKVKPKKRKKENQKERGGGGEMLNFTGFKCVS